MHRRLKTIAASLAVAAVVASASTLGASPAYADASGGNTLSIDAGTVIRPVTHVGAGGLYALGTATTPDPAILLPLHLNQLTQPAPGVTQLGNGATTPSGDALKVAGSVVSIGAQQTVRMPDIYPDFPYKWVNWDDYLAKVDTMVQQRLAATSTTNINGWELWNEPDGTWNTTAAGPFNDGWTKIYNEVKKYDTLTPIVGPSISSYSHAYMLSFLTAAKANNTVPDVISWHQWSADGLAGAITDLDSVEDSLGITRRPVSINEYAWPTQVDVPSLSLRYLADFERQTQVRDAERAYWYEAGTVGGLLYNGQPTSTYWLYKWYGDMTGNMLSVSQNGAQDGIASLDSSRKILDAVVGGATGDNTVAVKNLVGFGSNVSVNLQYTPVSGRLQNQAAPVNVWTKTLPVVNGTVTVPIGTQDPGGAYNIVLTPAAGPTSSYQQTYEAESATVVNGTREASPNASNGYYIDGLTGTGDERIDSFIDFLVNAPAAGAYNLSIRYANANPADATQGLAYDGGTWNTVTYPSTGGADQFSTVNGPTVTLHQGYNVVRLAKGSPYFAGGNGSISLDSIALTAQANIAAPATPADAPVATFVTRVEAENSTVSDGQKLSSANASGGGYVGTLNNADSYVQFSANVPTAGNYKLTIGYANGGCCTENGTVESQQALSVNGGASTNVYYPASGDWGGNGGSFVQASTTVSLNAGANTLRLTRIVGQNYAELDYAQLSSPANAYVDGRASQTIAAGTPTITGAALVGNTLTADPGTWAPADVSLAYQWLSNGTAITGATSATYTPTSSDVGHQISVTVTATKDSYATASATSAPTGNVQGVVVAGTPAITGSAAVGSTLTADPGTWAPSDAILSYQWLSNGSPVAGAGGNTYTPTASDAGKHISVTVTGNKSGYVGASATSTATGPVANPADAATVTLTSANAPSAAGWYAQNVTVTLTAPTAGQKVQYSLNDGTWTNYRKVLTVSTNGQSTLDTRVLDSKGDLVGGSTTETVVKIDKTKPVVTLTRTPDVSTGTPRNPLTFLFTATDTYSGVASIQYQINGGGWVTGSDPLVLDQVGTYSIAYQAIDAAGNTTAIKTVTATIKANVTTSVKASASTVKVGAPVTLSVAGFARFDNVQITFGATTTSVLTDVNGTAKITIIIPTGTPTGPTTITATGSDSITTATTTITIK